MKEATDIHTCSYHCDRPECVKVQRDELREAIAKKDAEIAALTGAWPTKAQALKYRAALRACVEALEAATSQTIGHDEYFQMVDAAIQQAKEAQK